MSETHKKIEILTTLVLTLIFAFMTKNIVGNFSNITMLASTENCDSNHYSMPFSLGYYITTGNCSDNFVKVNFDSKKSVCCDKKNSEKIFHNQDYINFLENLKTIYHGDCIELKLNHMDQSIPGFIMITIFFLVYIFNNFIQIENKSEILTYSNFVGVFLFFIYIYISSHKFEFFSEYFFYQNLYKIFYSSFLFSIISYTALALKF